MRAGRIDVVAAVTTLEANRVILADGAAIAPTRSSRRPASTPTSTVWSAISVFSTITASRGGFSSILGDGMFAIGHGIPPNGPLRAIRLAATPLACSDRGLPVGHNEGESMALLTAKRFFYRGVEEDEAARRDTVWNGILPQRFPDVIVQARDADTSSPRSASACVGLPGRYSFRRTQLGGKPFA